MKFQDYINQASGIMPQFPTYFANATDARGLGRAMIAHQALNGADISHLADTYCVSEGSIRTWVGKIVHAGSWIAVENQPKTGRPKKLSAQMLSEIDFAIQDDPSEYGYNVWDGKALSSFILRRYGISYSVRSCQYLFKKLGFRLIRPQVFPALGEENRQDRLEFVGEVKALELDKIDPVFEDEVHFSNQTTVTRMWAKKGSEPQVKSNPTEKSLPLFGFASVSTGEVFTQEPIGGKFNFNTTIDAVRAYLAGQPTDKEKYTVFILDRAPWHKKAVRLIDENENGQYNDILDRAGFMLLPPRSPDLNPIEQLWRKIRREVTHNRYFKSTAELREKISDYLKKFEKENDEMKNLLSFKNYWPKEEKAA